MSAVLCDSFFRLIPAFSLFFFFDVESGSNTEKRSFEKASVILRCTRGIGNFPLSLAGKLEMASNSSKSKSQRRSRRNSLRDEPVSVSEDGRVLTDTDFPEHFEDVADRSCLSTKGKQKVGMATRSSTKNRSLIKAATGLLAVSEEEIDLPKMPSLCPSSDEGMDIGKEMFNFQPAKSGGRRTDRQSKNQLKATATKNVGNNSQEEEEEEEEADSKRKRTEKDLPATSKGSLQREFNRLSSGSSEEDEVEDLDEKELSDIALDLTRSSRSLEDNQDALESYFVAQSAKRIQTSNHTMSGITFSSVSDKSASIVPASLKFHQDKTSLMEMHKQFYPHWLLQLGQGFNILLYGLGSKHALIQGFIQQYLRNTAHIIVNGYFPGLSAKHILRSITSELLNYSGTFRTETEWCYFISTTLAGTLDGNSLEVYLIINNMDGPLLQNEKAQDALSLLASSPHIHIVASVDHINAPLLWNQWQTSRFNWIWYNATTYAPYCSEVSYENYMIGSQTGALALSSLLHVLKSLTPSSCSIFELLAHHQIDHVDDSSYLGIPFQDFCLKCREKFLVSSDLALRAQLTEFRDHNLLKSRKGTDGVENLFIPLDKSCLVEYFDTKQDD